MEELINRLKQYEDPEPDSEWKYGKNYGLMVAGNEIKKAITSCEYCKYYKKTAGTRFYCARQDGLSSPSKNDFCSRGEK